MRDLYIFPEPFAVITEIGKRLKHVIVRGSNTRFWVSSEAGVSAYRDGDNHSAAIVKNRPEAASVIRKNGLRSPDLD